MEHAKNDEQIVANSRNFFNLCSANQLEEAKRQYEDGVNLEFKDKVAGVTALMAAAVKGYPEIVQFLLESGASTETQDKEGRTPLAAAAKNGDVPIMEALLEKGADINAVNKTGNPVILDCMSDYKISADKEKIVKWLAEKGADIQKTGENNRTVLHFAIQCRSLNLLQFFIDKGADLNAENKNGETPLKVAKTWHLSEFINLLDTTAQPAPANSEAPDTIEKIEDTEAFADYDTLAELCSGIADAKCTSSFRVNSVRQYLKTGGGINDTLLYENGKYQTNLLERAIEIYDISLIQFVLESGFDFDAAPPEGGRPYYIKAFLNSYLQHIGHTSNKEKYPLEDVEKILSIFFDMDFTLSMEDVRYLKGIQLSDFYSYYPDSKSPSNSAEKLYYKLLVSKCADINEVDTNGQTLLHHTLQNYRPDFFRAAPMSIAPAKEPNPGEFCHDDLFIEALLNSDAIDLNLADYQDYPPLYYACKKTNASIVIRLIQAGADMEYLCGTESLPLTYVACVNRKWDILSAFIDYGADVNAANKYAESLLMAACNTDTTEAGWIDTTIISDLLEKGADPSLANNAGNTALHYLMFTNADQKAMILKSSGKHKWEEILSELQNAAAMLLDKGADLEAVNHNGRTALAIAAIGSYKSSRCEKIPLVQFLLDRGAFIDARDNDGQTIFHNAVEAGDINLVALLLENGASADIKDNKDVSPYKMAIDKNQRTIISKIEKATASLGMDGDDLDAAFMRACAKGHRGVAEMLVKTGNIDVTYVDDRGRTPLHYIAGLGMLALAQFVIDNGVDVNYTDRNNQTALHFAAGRNQKEMLKFLISCGADVNIADKEGILPIHLVANYGQHDMLETLLENGADSAVMDNEGENLLHMACHIRAKECVRVLLDRSVNPNVLNRHGITPLVISAGINQKEIVAMLLDAGADIHAKDIDGDEAIHIAARKCFKDMISLLLQRGSQINTLNNNGFAPLHIAAYWGYKDIFKFLLDKGADFELKTGAGKTCIDMAAENGQKELIELIAIMQKRRKMTEV